jgi:hypothetical protein
LAQSKRAVHPIASLKHVAAYAAEAEMAIDRATEAALKGVSVQELKSLPLPPHYSSAMLSSLTCMANVHSPEQPEFSAAPLASKRPSVGQVSERHLASGAGSKRHKQTKNTVGNPFATFAFSNDCFDK